MMDFKKYQFVTYDRDVQIIGFNEVKHIVLDGFNVVIKRVGGLHLCGYVEIPCGLIFDKEAIDCHGGVTFSNSDIDDFPTNGYYIGFDCGHASDWNPAFWQEGTYKDTGFVLGELWKITQQLKGLQNE